MHEVKGEHKTTRSRVVFVLLQGRMDPKPQKPSLLFANPLSWWTEYTLKLWGFGKSDAPEKQVAVAVVPTDDAPKASKPKLAQVKARKRKTKSKRARR